MSSALPDSDWLPFAARLPVGGRVREAHSCGEGSPLLITRSADKSTAYCFRCGGTGFKAEHESIEAKLARIRNESAADEEVRRSIDLPQPQVFETKDWPLDAKVWFFKMGLSLSMIRELGLYWCPSIGRVVLPVWEGDRLVYWLARSHCRAPKWINPNVNKDGLCAKYGVGKGDTIVLCEDALSAYKVGHVTESWSLLGTKLHSSTLVSLVQSGKRVGVWLDDDRGRKNGSNPGQEAAREILSRLRALGVTCHNIKSKRDPKFYSPEEIKEKLSCIL